MVVKLKLFEPNQPKKLTSEEEFIRTLIQRRRLQILIHSCIYYRLNDNLVSDELFDSWCRELVKLQKEYRDISNKVVYAEDFKDFDGSSGYDLPYGDLQILNKAQSLINYERKTNGKTNKVF